MTDRLKGKVAIITGAASGIGQGAAKLFSDEGATVVGADLNTDNLNKEINKITETGKDALAERLDVSDADSWQKVVDDTIKQFGKIDILVNVAGISNFKDIFQTKISDWNKIISVDATGTFLGMKTVAPKMQKNGKGSIVNTASVAALSRRSTCSNAGRTPVIFSIPSSTSILEFERLSTITTS